MKCLRIAEYRSAVASQFSICFRLSQLCRYFFIEEVSKVAWLAMAKMSAMVFRRTPLNKRALLPHVRSFLELKGDQ